jgi:hypothetical protein
VLTIASVAGLSPLACDAPAAKGDVKARTPDAAAAAPAPAVDDEALLRAARLARDAATAMVRKCSTTYETDNETITLYDTCTWTAVEESGVRASAAALRELASTDASSSTSLRGPAATFVDQFRLFAAWVELLHDLPKRGTLAHYQELALAWNAWRPAEPIAPDPVRVSYPSWAGVDAGPDGGDAGLLAWARCPTGVCIVKPVPR